MSNTLNELETKKAVAEIQNFGEKLIVPEGMTITQAIDLLERRNDYLEENTVLRAKFPVFPWDGAYGFSQVLIDMFGWAPAEPVPGFFGDSPPEMIEIEIGYGQKATIAWGRFSIPTVKDGYIQCGADMVDGQLCFSLSAKVKRKYEHTVKEIFDRLTAYLKSNSIYAGQAIKMRFRDEDGDRLRMPEPEFLRTDHISKDMLIYNDDVQEAIQTNLFTPIERIQDCIANDIPTKRGVLLGGPYGTGKTLAATVASRLAVDNKVTYLYVPRADELGDAIAFAKQYQANACVIFCEDIDRAVNGERSVKMDDILNILDGIDTKGNKIITVLTTNHLENINPAMLRPGRLDAVIDVEAPNAESVIKLIHLYGKGAVAADADLSAVGEVLQGVIPATVAEVVKRAKLSQVALQEAGTPIETLSPEALLSAAKTMRKQVDALAELNKDKTPEPTIDDIMGGIFKKMQNQEQLDNVESKVKYISERV